MFFYFFRNAQLENAQALIIILNTPGGGFEETKKIIEHIETSPVPVIGYVYPKGATAWSAGTLILLATDIAAMAPKTKVVITGKDGAVLIIKSHPGKFAVRAYKVIQLSPINR